MAIFDGSKRINGVAYSWSSIKLIFGGQEVDFIGSISFNDKRPRSKGYGLGRSHRPKKRSAGRYELEPMKLKGFTNGINGCRSFLADYAIDGRSYGNVIFDVAVSLIENDEVPLDVMISGAVWSTNNDDYQEGPDLLMSEAEFDIMGIDRYQDGRLLTLYDSSEEVPV